eukprot:124985-Hanusia_phi.AAC.1
MHATASILPILLRSSSRWLKDGSRTEQTVGMPEGGGAMTCVSAAAGLLNVGIGLFTVKQLVGHQEVMERMLKAGEEEIVRKIEALIERAE